MVREGIRSLRFFKKSMPKIRKSSSPEDLKLFLEKENEIRSIMMKSLNNLKVNKIDVNNIEEYLIKFGKPDDWK